MKPDHTQLHEIILTHGSGNTARVNHNLIADYCGGDSKSMKLAATPEGGISWVCFRCGEHGYAIPAAVARRLNTTSYQENTEDTKPWKREMPGGEADPTKWSRAARDWLLQYVLVEDVVRYGAVEAHNRLWLPVTYGGTPVKWAGRKLFEFDRVKYLTGMRPEYRVHDPIIPIGWQGRRLIIVEDWVSAVAVSTKLKCAALPLMGVALSVPQQQHIYTTADSVTVWLDNDGPQISKAGRKLTKDLRGYGIDVSIFRGLGDPKTELAELPHSQRGELVSLLGA